MRRSVLLGAVVAVALVLGAAAVALAATINCTAETKCSGTKRPDTLNGSPGGDLMYGRAGGDAMYGRNRADLLQGGLGADKVLAGVGNDNVVWGGERRGTTSPYTWPDKSDDLTSGGPGVDRVYGGFGQGGVDRVLGNGANDTIIVAQRGFPVSMGKVKVTKEVVDCGTGEDTVYRDRRRDVIANDCEHKRSGFPVLMFATKGSPGTKGLFEAVPSGR